MLRSNTSGSNSSDGAFFRAAHPRIHSSLLIARVYPNLTLPTKVRSDSLGRIGSLKRTSDKSLFPIALGSCDHRITHQLRPINMNGRSILSVTSIYRTRELETPSLAASERTGSTAITVRADDSGEGLSRAAATGRGSRRQVYCKMVYPRDRTA